MQSFTSRQRLRVLPLACAAVWAGCGGAGSSLEPLEATLSDCGSGLDELSLAGSLGSEPRIEASYSEALASWPARGQGCGLGVLGGQCADGKRLLYRNNGFGSEIRYFDGEQLVGYVLSGDVGACPSICPFSHYYGAIDSVRCDSPSFEDLCTDASRVLDGADPPMPFADGRAPGGCGD